MKVLFINEKKEFYEIKSDLTMEVNGIHVGYGTLEPKRLEAKDAVVIVDVEEEEFNEIMDFALEGVKQVEIHFTEKHKVTGDAQLFMNINTDTNTKRFKIQMSIK